MKTNISDNLLAQILPLIKDRLVKLSDFSALTAGFVAPPVYDPALWKDLLASRAHLEAAQSLLSSAEWSKSGIETPLLDHLKSVGWKVGDFFMSLRIAVWGSRFTPPLTDVMLILGKAETLSRIQSALNHLTSQ